MTGRMEPAAPAYAPGIADQINRIMRGQSPPVLFTISARDPRLFNKFFGSSLLDRRHLTKPRREGVIDRTTALCHPEHESNVHLHTFVDHAGLDAQRLRSIVHGTADDDCGREEEPALIRPGDALHESCDCSDEAPLELLMLAGLYRTINHPANAARLPLEEGAARFPT